MRPGVLKKNYHNTKETYKTIKAQRYLAPCTSSTLITIFFSSPVNGESQNYQGETVHAVKSGNHD